MPVILNTKFVSGTCFKYIELLNNQHRQGWQILWRLIHHWILISGEGDSIFIGLPYGFHREYYQSYTHKKSLEAAKKRKESARVGIPSIRCSSRTSSTGIYIQLLVFVNNIFPDGK